MAEVNDKFNLRDWEWIAVHFPLSERENIGRAAQYICKCSPEQVSQYNPDPRIVIPLCAIKLLDKKYFLDLKKFATEKEIDNYQTILEQSERQQENYNIVKQEFINPAINSINPSEIWLSLFETLDIHLQFNLLYCLIKYRRPTRDDWRNIFLDCRPVPTGLLVKDLLQFFSLSILFILLLSIELLKMFILNERILTLYGFGIFYFSWKIILFIWVITLVFALILWIYAHNLQRKIDNPLKNIVILRE